MRMMKHRKGERCDAKLPWSALASLCSRFPAGSVRVAHRATATVESLQLIASADLVRTRIHDR